MARKFRKLSEAKTAKLYRARLRQKPLEGSTALRITPYVLNKINYSLPALLVRCHLIHLTRYWNDAGPPRTFSGWFSVAALEAAVPVVLV